MTSKEARQIVRDFDDSKVLTDEDEFMFTEAMNFLIEEEHKPQDMMYLGGWYYEQRRFELALKYYEMAAAFDHDPAYECLGYIWFYGRTGERDYKKAFEYFSKLMEKGNLVSSYKVADMYKNGCYVEKDHDKYVEIIELLYPKAQKLQYVEEPLPEIFTRLARIRIEQGRKADAIELYLKAKDWLSWRIKYNAFFGNLNIMKWMVEDLYTLIEFDPDVFGLFDFYYLLKTPHKVTFEYEDKEYCVESVQEENNCSIHFGDKWYVDLDAFFQNAAINNVKLTAIWDELYFFILIS